MICVIMKRRKLNKPAEVHQCGLCRIEGSTEESQVQLPTIIINFSLLQHIRKSNIKLDGSSSLTPT